MTRFRDFISVLNGFRKLSVMFLLITIASLFRVFDYINGIEFVKLMSSVGVAFMATNGLEHMMKTVQKFIEKKVEGKDGKN